MIKKNEIQSNYNSDAVLQYASGPLRWIEVVIFTIAIVFSVYFILLSLRSGDKFSLYNSSFYGIAGLSLVTRAAKLKVTLSQDELRICSLGKHRTLQLEQISEVTTSSFMGIEIVTIRTTFGNSFRLESLSRWALSKSKRKVWNARDKFSQDLIDYRRKGLRLS